MEYYFIKEEIWLDVVGIHMVVSWPAHHYSDRQSVIAALVTLGLLRNICRVKQHRLDHGWSIDLVILQSKKYHARPHLPTFIKKKDTTSSLVSQSNPFSLWSWSPQILFIFDQQGQLWAELPHHQNLWQMPTNLSNCHNFWLPNAQCPALILFEKSFPNHEKLYQCSGSHDYLV